MMNGVTRRVANLAGASLSEIKHYSKAFHAWEHASTTSIFAVLCAATTALCRRVATAAEPRLRPASVKLRRGYITKRTTKKAQSMMLCAFSEN